MSHDHDEHAADESLTDPVDATTRVPGPPITIGRTLHDGHPVACGTSGGPAAVAEAV